MARAEEAISELEAQNATGGDPPAVSLPPELANAKALRRRVGEALARVEQEDGPSQTNLTDEDAALLSTSKGNFITGYNAQSMVSPLSTQDEGPGGMLITAVDVTSSSDDQPQLVPMIEAAAENIGAREDVVTVADRRIPFGSQPCRVRHSRPPGADGRDQRPQTPRAVP